MKTHKQHRIVNAAFGRDISLSQTLMAVECAENEGWPIIPLAMEGLPSVARTGGVRRAARHLVHHFYSEYRFWSGLPEGVRRVSH